MPGDPNWFSGYRLPVSLNLASNSLANLGVMNIPSSKNLEFGIMEINILDMKTAFDCHS